MYLGTRLSLWFSYRYVGQDEFGNRYYRARFLDSDGKFRRMVWYNGMPEPTKVPPVWHAWLHYVTDKVPETHPNKYGWQQPHHPNLTGTPYAYFPTGHLRSGGKRAEATGDYQPWRPSKQTNQSH
jgi:NADH:ubiquinone oxidoreductase subunit